MQTTAEVERGEKVKQIEVRLAYPNSEALRREREHSVRDIRDLMSVSLGLDSEHKRIFLEDARVFGEPLFNPEEHDVLAGMTDEELGRALTRLESLLKISA
jgi:hypothetical protein